MRTNRRTAGTGGALAVAAALVASSLAGVADAGPAAAAPVRLGLDYHCTFPLLGPRPVHVELSSDVPASVQVGQVMQGFVVDSVSTVDAESTRGLVALYSTTLEGHALAEATLTVPEEPDGLPVEVDSALDKTTLPASGSFTVKGKGTSPDLTFSRAGRGKVTVGNLVLTLTPRTDDGGETGLGTFESECTQDPGQNNVLAEFDITDPATQGPTGYTYTLKGTSTVKASNGTVPLTGGMSVEVQRGTGAVTGDLTLDPAKGSFHLLGFLPASADLAFAAQGRTTGTYTGGKLTAKSAVAVRMPAVSVFGIPLGGGDQCRTSKPSDITLTSAGAFDPAAGGRVAGAYELAPLADCGVLTGLLSSAVAGPGNALDLTLTPKPKG
ncbi:DUF6801 domain-containing protein [Actinomadura fibrosa]|uniref:DUF6801 domain-containing protein n=1 Tax=Actinomadura fibrosa TaxID=111802 RepID=A0ABW2XCQ0_9ACTN|nr:DUF6801 domain-containing protein [Actinomadura fibrosa]